MFLGNKLSILGGSDSNLCWLERNAGPTQPRTSFNILPIIVLDSCFVRVGLTVTNFILYVKVGFDGLQLYFISYDTLQLLNYSFCISCFSFPEIIKAQN